MRCGSKAHVTKINDCKLMTNLLRILPKFQRNFFLVIIIFVNKCILVFLLFWLFLLLFKNYLVSLISSTIGVVCSYQLHNSLWAPTIFQLEAPKIDKLELRLKSRKTRKSKKSRKSSIVKKTLALSNVSVGILYFYLISLFIDF